MIKQHWWKALGVGLILYTLICGLSVPIKPALIDAAARTISTAKSGDALTLTATGYNTFFKQNTTLNVWLAVEDSARTQGGKPDIYPIRAASVHVLDETHLEATFNLPKFLPLSKKLVDANLVLDGNHDGFLIRKTIVQVSQDSVDVAAGKQLWAADMDIAPHAKTFTFPDLQFTRETIRNTFFHVPMWFVMFTLYGLGLWYSIQYLRKQNTENDLTAVSFTRVGTFFGLLGLATGGTWANFAWGQPFPIQEIKLLMTYTALAIYFAYFILRLSFDDFERRARISAVYSIFSFASLVPLLYVIPKLANASSHPGNGGKFEHRCARHGKYDAFGVLSRLHWLDFAGFVGRYIGSSQ